MKYSTLLRLIPEAIAFTVVVYLDRKFHFTSVNSMMTFMIVAVYVRTILQEVDVVVE